MVLPEQTGRIVSLKQAGRLSTRQEQGIEGCMHYFDHRRKDVYILVQNEDGQPVLPEDS